MRRILKETVNAHAGAANQNNVYISHYSKCTIIECQKYCCTLDRRALYILWLHYTSSYRGLNSGVL